MICATCEVEEGHGDCTRCRRMIAQQNRRKRESESPPPSSSASEIAEHVSAVMDHLRWFWDRGISLRLVPRANGWTLKLRVPE